SAAKRRNLSAETFEGIFQRLARKAEYPRILCGDFNAPEDEQPDETIVPFAKTARGKAAELSVLRGLARFDLADAYRYCHGYGAREFSWYDHRGRGFRIDHLLASGDLLDSVECSYLQELRDRGLSDHAALESGFAH